ncbi:MAG: hypothetical protein J6S61_05595 [Elusimicrobiaceae bacterium]|nr:hypothetical protein [Elusimicrobiaceae bacterium]
MSKKGSALMQVLVIGLIIAAFAVLILRYAITRSANLSRTDRILQSQIIADSCLEQYMSYLSAAELYGMPYSSSTATFKCYYYQEGESDPQEIVMGLRFATDINNSSMTITTFTVPVRTSL